MYARALREQKKYVPAANEFYKAAQLRPESAEAWSDLAGMLILTENYQQALAALDKVRALGAEKAAHHYFRAIVLDKFHQFKPAVESYQKFLELSQGKNPDVHWHLARIRSDQKRYAEAADELEQFLKVRPDARDAEKIRQLIRQLREKAAAAANKS